MRYAILRTSSQSQQQDPADINIPDAGDHRIRHGKNDAADPMQTKAMPQEPRRQMAGSESGGVRGATPAPEGDVGSGGGQIAEAQGVGPAASSVVAAEPPPATLFHHCIY